MKNLFDNIYGDNINLIELSLDYLDDMFEYSSDDKLYEYFEFIPQRDIENTREYLVNLMKRSDRTNAYWWFIQFKETSKVVGTFGIHSIEIRRGNCEISYAVSSNYWGKGVFIEALNMVLKSLFNDFNFHRVTAVTSSQNIRSINALKKVGFKEEGVFRDQLLYADGHREDTTSLALLVHEYRYNKLSK